MYLSAIAACICMRLRALQYIYWDGSIPTLVLLSSSTSEPCHYTVLLARPRTHLVPQARTHMVSPVRRARTHMASPVRRARCRTDTDLLVRSHRLRRCSRHLHLVVKSSQAQ